MRKYCLSRPQKKIAVKFNVVYRHIPEKMEFEKTTIPFKLDRRSPTAEGRELMLFARSPELDLANEDNVSQALYGTYKTPDGKYFWFREWAYEEDGVDWGNREQVKKAEWNHQYYKDIYLWHIQLHESMYRDFDKFKEKIKVLNTIDLKTITFRYLFHYLCLFYFDL